MKTINKSILPSILISGLILLASCEGLLDPEPTTGVGSERSIYDRQSANTVLSGTYYLLSSSGYYGLNYNFIPFLFADNVGFVGIQTYYKIFVRNNGYGETSLQSDNSALSSVWSAVYRTINNANNLIAKVDKVDDPDFTREERDRILGQAYFIRALAYFDLTRYWGGVQIVLTPTTSPDGVNGIKRSSLEETYAQIAGDLLRAEELLKATDSRIYADLGAAQALSARFNLYRKDWAKAESYSSLLIANEKYEPVKPYSVSFTTKLSRESIFELAYTTSNANPSALWWQPAELGGRYEVTFNDEVTALLEDESIGGERADIVAVTEKGGLRYNAKYWRAGRDDPGSVLRIAEQYLIRAEARVRQGDLAGGLDDINKIRERAGVPPLAIGEYNTAGKVLLAVEDEWRLEFPDDGHRFFNLARTGRLGAVLGEVEGYLFPIPIDELNKDEALEPNPSN
ncbi:MAG: RagB/SusD family nutrient uptake outer membrane protein [Tannerellaceae bacterium]|nr:RagB/SusD family nutrient uptake outer membrane protein [Tannerellaceae bacterium]